jgi:hypothetical protein
MTAEVAGVDPNREGLSDHLAAAGTPLSGETRQYLNNSTTSFFRFIVEDGDKTRPTRVGDTFCERPVLCQTLYIEIFDGNESVPVDVFAGRFVEKVLPLTGDFEVPLRGESRGSFASVGAFLSTTRLALRFSQFLLTPSIVTWVFDRLAFGIGEKNLQTQIYANGGAILERRSCSEVAYDEYIPVAVGSAHEVSRFRDTFDRTVLFYLDASTELLGDSEPLGLMVKEDIVSLTILPEMDGVPAIARFKAREADLLLALLTIEESPQGFVETTAERLDRGLGDVFTTAALELTGEIISTERFAALCVMVFNQFEHLVVNKARFGETGEEQSLLHTVRVETVFEGLVHALHCTEQASESTDTSPAAFLAHTAVGDTA